DWFYADLSGPISATQVITPGLLHVQPSGDITPPLSPQNLRVTFWDASSIALAWDAVTAPDLYAYDLYRYEEGKTSVDAAKIARILAPTTVYTDESVTTGNTYTYTVTALDMNFNESSPSNEVSATAEARMVDVRFVVNVPDFTPDTATVYIAGNNADVFGAFWNPAAQPITRVDDTTWMYTSMVKDGTDLQYKYTRGGSWETVEHWGTLIGLTNREVSVNYGATGVMTVTDAVHNWKDPLVIETYPLDKALAWDTTRPVSVTFNHLLDDSFINTTTFTLTNFSTGTIVDGTFGFDEKSFTSYSDPVFGSGLITGTVVLFTPTTPLSTTHGYQVFLASEGYVGTENEGIGMQADYGWDFGIRRYYMPLLFRSE
ncbi:MAG: carbohydrate-binding module family 20 domain-containing protein, partial [Anaerolineae bacterium]